MKITIECKDKTMGTGSSWQNTYELLKEKYIVEYDKDSGIIGVREKDSTNTEEYYIRDIIKITITE